MTETPREYKKRIDEKWVKNTINRSKLIHEINQYELLDPVYKEAINQKILDNFSKNQKADKESEQYTTVVSELAMIDKKYEELKGLKENLVKNENKKKMIEEEMRGIKLDGADETTLQIQMARVRQYSEERKSLEFEIEETKKEIENREQEIREIEMTYGVKDSTSVGSGNDGASDSQSHLFSQGHNDSSKKFSTLKEYHEHTIKDLWNKDRTRGEIFKLLDEGTGIDDELVEEIKKEITDRFFEYYDENQGSLRMKSAKFLKNGTRVSKGIYQKLKNMPDGQKREKLLSDLDKKEKIYGSNSGKMRALFTLSNKMDVESDEINSYGTIAGEPFIRVIDKNGYCRMVRGSDILYIKSRDVSAEITESMGKPDCKVKFGNNYYHIVWGSDYPGYHYAEMCDIQTIGGKPFCKMMEDDGEYRVYWGNGQCGGKHKEVGEIKEINGKPCFKAKDIDGDYRVYWGNEQCGEFFEEVGEIKEINGKPCFKAKDIDGDYGVYWGDEQCGEFFEEGGEIKEINGKPCFKVKDIDGDYRVYWGNEQCGYFYKEVLEMKDDDGRLRLKVKAKNGRIVIKYF